MVVNENCRFKFMAVDDNLNALEIIKRTLNNAGYEVLTCDNVMAAVGILNDQKIDIVITDLKMPKHSGLDLVKHIYENIDDIGIIMVTGYPSIEGAVEAIKMGAEEFLAKPFTAKDLLSAVQKVLDKLIIQRKTQAIVVSDQTTSIVGNSMPMKSVFKLIKKAAGMTANVLISGESGTGKELVARAIHYSSDRSSAPFIPVNCTAIPESLIESELFGYEKGAFTGANVSRDGFFKVAEGGTIFLDEIADASQGLQAKLLRVMQNKEIIKVGSSRIYKINTRILAATNKDLASLIKKSKFREDLYYRLNVLEIPIPPLREHKEDVPLLIRHFNVSFCREMERKHLTFSDRALKALVEYAWPGNIRELENVIQKLVATMDTDSVDIADLPESMRFVISRGKGRNKSLAQVESEHIKYVLESVDGNKTKAAKILKIHRKTLREKFKRIEQTT